ncbi:MAG: hypothetical protein NT087_05235 [Deltaproteobacteria bacterium]|nr:hypothetical protein [Deltaproteobacteria bacterium]
MTTQEAQEEETISLNNEKGLIWGLPRSVVSFVIILLASAIFYRLVTVDVVLQFDFPAFLSLLLALFSVGLSALFYFKATETSNSFYDNTHKFTREVSQILGRIEAGFGERLRHLDEGYTGLRDRFEKLPFDVSKAREQEEEEKQEVAKKEAELQALLNDLANRAKLAENEKKELFAKLEQTQDELAMSKGELLQVQRRIRSAEELKNLPEGFREYLAGWMKENLHKSLRRAYINPALIRNEFTQKMEALSGGAISVMKRYDLLDENNELTPAGSKLIRDVVRECRDNI